MFHKRIILDGRSDADAVLAALQGQCAGAGLSPDQTEAVLREVRGPLDTLIRSGRDVEAARGQFRATRRLVTDVAAVTLDARFGMPPGLLDRLLKVLRRKG